MSKLSVGHSFEVPLRRKIWAIKTLNPEPFLDKETHKHEYNQYPSYRCALSPCFVEPLVTFTEAPFAVGAIWTSAKALVILVIVGEVGIPILFVSSRLLFKDMLLIPPVPLISGNYLQYWNNCKNLLSKIFIAANCPPVIYTVGSQVWTKALVGSSNTGRPSSDTKKFPVVARLQVVVQAWERADELGAKVRRPAVAPYPGHHITQGAERGPRSIIPWDPSSSSCWRDPTPTIWACCSRWAVVLTY